MIPSFALRYLSLPTLLVGFGLAAVNQPTPASATFSAAASSLSVAASAPAPDWLRGYTPTQFRQLDVARQSIDPADFDEPLLAAAIFQETNQQRANLQLPAFLPDERASVVARLHSQWMARHHALSHNETSNQGQPITPHDRLMRQGLRLHITAENIAYNFALDLVPGKPFYVRVENGRNVYSYQPGGPSLRAYTYDGFAQAIVTQWMHSPLHRANIVDSSLRFLGVGAAPAHRPNHQDTIYATQDFYTPYASAASTLAPTVIGADERVTMRPSPTSGALVHPTT